MIAENTKMILQLPQKKRRNVLIDIDTQRDYLLADGQACIWNHSEVLAHIRRVMAWARHEDILVISIAEVCSGNNHFDTSYRIDEPNGRKKVHYTLLASHTSFPADDGNALPLDLLRAHKQVILHKRSVDPFEEPRIERLLSEIRADEFVLIGAGTEDAIEATALGLLQRGRNVSIVVDAIGSHDRKEGKLALRKMKAKGARLVTAKTLAGISHLRYISACKCSSCKNTATTEATKFIPDSQAAHC